MDGLSKRSLFWKKTAVRSADIAWKILRAFLLLGLSFVLLYPILYMVVMTFRPAEDIYDPTVIWISNRLTLENLKNAVAIMNYKSALLNTLLINLVSSLLQVMVCSLTGYGFARFQFRGKNLLFAVVLFTIIVPPQIISTPTYINYQFFDFFGIGSLLYALTGLDIRVSLINSVFAFYLPAVLGAGLKSGLFIFLFRQFYRGLPMELEDAAAIDGCGFAGCYLRIMLPNAGTILLTVLILSSVWYWNDYFMSSMYLSTKETVTTALVNLEGNSAVLTGDVSPDPYKIVTLMQAGCLLTILPLLLVYIVLQRFLVQGVERSGIVG